MRPRPLGRYYKHACSYSMGARSNYGRHATPKGGLKLAALPHVFSFHGHPLGQTSEFNLSKTGQHVATCHTVILGEMHQFSLP